MKRAALAVLTVVLTWTLFLLVEGTYRTLTDKVEGSVPILAILITASIATLLI